MKKASHFHGTNMWEPRWPPSSSSFGTNAIHSGQFFYPSSNALLPSFLHGSQHAYESPQGCRQAFFSPLNSIHHSFTFLKWRVSEDKREETHFLPKESQQSSCFSGFIRMPLAEKGARGGKQHRPEINPAKGLVLLSFLSASVSVPIFIGYCWWMCFPSERVHSLLSLFIAVETLFCHTEYRKWD